MSSKQAFEAMKAGEWGKVKEIISTISWAPAELEKKHGGKYTALFSAAQSGHLKAAEILLDRGVDIDAMDEFDSTPLMEAARFGHSEVVAMLAARGANIHARSKAVEILLDRGADMEAKTMSGCTPLMKASVYGHSEVVALLVDRGADINTRENTGRSALRRSAEGGQVAVVKLLCSKGVDIDAQNVKEYMHDIRSWRPTGYSAKKKEIIAAIQAEVEWRRVRNFVVFLHAGGLSAADWSVRGLSGGGSIAATDGTITPYIPSSGFTLIGRQSKVLENRDLCRIVVSYIPKKHVDFYSIE